MNMKQFKSTKLGQFKQKRKLEKLNQMINRLPFNTTLLSNGLIKKSLSTRRQEKQKSVAYFCEHDGIFIQFRPARSTWHALAPCALKPWWLFLNPNKKTDTDR